QTAAQWRALSGRERRLVGVAAIALALGGLWLLGVEPALRQVVRWEAEIPKLRSQAQALEQVLAEVPPAPAVPSASDSGNAVADVRAGLEAAGLPAEVQAVASPDGQAT